MAVPIAAVVEGAKIARDLLKHSNSGEDSSSSTVNVNKYDDSVDDLKRTEGDLGFDEEEKETPTVSKPVDEDPSNPMETTDIEQAENTPVETATEVEENNTENEADRLPNFSQESPLTNIAETAGSILGQNNDKKITTQGIDSNHTSDSVNYNASLNGSPSIGSSSSNDEPIVSLSLGGSFSQMMDENSEESKSLFEQAEEALKDGDIDAKELPFVSDEQSAEDIEDLLQNKELSDEEKENILEQAVEEEKDGKLEEGDLKDDINEEEEKPAEKNETEEKPAEKEDKGILATINDKIDTVKDSWENSPAKELLDKGVKLGEILYGFFGLPSNVSSSSGESVSLNQYEDSVEDISNDSGLNFDEKQSSNKTSSSGSFRNETNSISSASKGGNTVSNSTGGSNGGKVATKAGLGSIENKVANSSTSSNVKSGGVREAFDRILANGNASSKTSGSSSFTSALGGEYIGSVGKAEKAAPLKIAASANPNLASNNIVKKIHQEVKEDWRKWPSKDGVHYKDKGSIALFTENGIDVDVKFGTRRILPLEKLDEQKLQIVEQVI